MTTLNNFGRVAVLLVTTAESNTSSAARSELSIDSLYAQAHPFMRDIRRRGATYTFGIGPDSKKSLLK